MYIKNLCLTNNVNGLKEILPLNDMTKTIEILRETLIYCIKNNYSLVDDFLKENRDISRKIIEEICW